MKDTTAKKRIAQRVEKACKGKSDTIKKYLRELIFRDYLYFKEDYEDQSDTNNLNFALEIHLEEDFKTTLAELEAIEKSGKTLKI
jgi:deoxyribodipyrimidine photolyase